MRELNQNQSDVANEFARSPVLSLKSEIVLPNKIQDELGSRVTLRLQVGSYPLEIEGDIVKVKIDLVRKSE